MAIRPANRQKTYFKKRTWNDEVQQYNRDRRVYRAESRVNASRVVDENPLAQLQIRQDRKNKQAQDKRDAQVRPVKKRAAYHSKITSNRIKDEASQMVYAKNHNWKETPKWQQIKLPVTYKKSNKKR